MVTLAGIPLENRLLLAPMAGVTDAAFRLACREQGAALAYTEMVSSRGLMYNDAKTAELLYSPEGDRPLGVQLFGSEPEIMAEAAPRAVAMANGVLLDINMGCPVGKVVRSGDGSALMRDPDRAGRIIEACVRTAGVPVTVKFRKGWDSGSVNAVEFARMCEQAGAAAVTVHGRTRVQMYGGAADRDIIRDVKQAVSIPVIANGDVFDGADARRMLERTGADFVMIGRGCFGDPWLFARAAAALEGREEPPPPPLAERMDRALRQVEDAARWKGEHIACLEARKQLCWYLRGVRDSAPYKRDLTQLQTVEDARRILGHIKANLR